ncbi:zinc finger ran-binding domain-containing protein 3 [Chrysochromulina tobinii]|uniref:Zinc finger ran-binding domain-containing protein 3 n=1 Tax=Chrysochromulina tobinii TaxID=1460289 RepID=A0A0M0J4H8_9EUKA|nr:zinc finger ran-binding domain-containing protein 3 [Chrysochromulina tobinii]|eukprot:KOO21504.1 zinc finger ran-binding domain-containing protein 3 [Chrysochromulina sp. CCMP291]
MSETRDERGKQHLLSQMCVALGSAKAHAAAELVLEMLPSCRDGRLLFFAHHKAMLDAVDAAAASARVRTFRIDGSVPAVERAGLVNSFQALPADTPAIFLLSILAAGQGLTLTGASTAVFGELRWTPGELLQAEDRCHRIGQRSSVNVYYLVAKDTADEAMWAVLQRKVRALGAALDGRVRQRLHVEGEERRIEGASQEDCADEAAAKASPKPAATATAASSSATPMAHTMTPSTTIDLTREFDEAFDEAAGDATASAPAAAAAASRVLGSPSDAIATSAARSSAAGATPAGTDLVEGWFAVSVLTGRVHAFGGDDAPLPAGMGASALPHEILDDDPSSLPLPLQEPSMLAAARRWVLDWEGLSPAQKAVLHDRPPARESPFCSDRCASQFSSAESQASARRQLFERELGVCQLCGFNAHAFYRRLVALPSEQERLQCVMGSPFSTASERLKRMLTAPKEGDFWEADHIVPSDQGGRKYAGLVDATLQTYRSEGIGALWLGFRINIVRTIPQSIVTFTMYEALSTALQRRMRSQHQHEHEHGHMPAGATGAVSGAAAPVVSKPVHVERLSSIHVIARTRS